MSTPYVVETSGLTKRFGERVAVDDVDLHVPRGSAFGYLGPNGAGKTTLIRMLLGLTRASAGSMRLLGRPVPAERAAALARVGAIVEEPRFHRYLTGRENLSVIAAAREREAHRRIEGALERVGLDERADERVSTYSLGMRQRLGLAQALLKDPDLLILDEPANGLDPAGIKEIRELLRSLGDEGRTVFVSSHLLGEIEHTCDRVAILSRGRCVAAGSVSEVLHRGRRPSLRVGVTDLDAGLLALREAGIPATRNSTHLHVDLPSTEAARVSETLARVELWVTELHADEVTLEEVFLELTAPCPLQEAL